LHTFTLKQCCFSQAQCCANYVAVLSELAATVLKVFVNCNFVLNLRDQKTAPLEASFYS
jgi:hypothetical protein